MMDKMRWMAAAAALGLAACGGGGDAAPEEEKPASLEPGLYEASWKVSALSSTDKTTPATNLEAGTSGTTKGCVADGPAIDPLMFAEDGDNCTATSSYARKGRINLQYECNREGQGRVMQTVSGSSTADGFEAEVSSSTYLTGPGDYSMTRSFTARRVGECPAEGIGDNGSAPADADGNASGAPPS